jgi:hypothetical protein
MHAALFSYVKRRGVLCCRAGGRPDDPCSDPAIMACLVPEQWRLRGYKDGGWLWRLLIGSRELLTLARTGYRSR